ncbi:peptidylprolyl isomerase [Paremcibacter congregatus]|nr:peptidylprolyl isomerase [Paremcibacter congregatus]
MVMLFSFPLLLTAEEVVIIEIATEFGPMTAELYPERAPLTVANFIQNIEEGLYEGGHFYRAVRLDHSEANAARRMVLIQGGRPEEKQPRRGIPHETTSQSGLSHQRGTLSMARGAPGTAATEFFICLGDNRLLDYESTERPGYAAFGQVIEGIDIAEKIQNGATGARNLSAYEKSIAPGWILPQLLNNSVSISNITTQK